LRITIHRAEPWVTVQGRRVRLTPSEHRLLTTLGQMDTRSVPTDLLIDLVFDHPVRIQADRDLLSTQICKLRKKIGGVLVRSQHVRGYSLRGEVEFR
jgi:DNA-binding response OmpR family regulator